MQQDLQNTIRIKLSSMGASNRRCQTAHHRIALQMRMLPGSFALSLAVGLAAFMLPLAFALTCSIDPHDVTGTTSCLSAVAASMCVAAAFLSAFATLFDTLLSHARQCQASSRPR
jgi:hypothetical protein